MTAAESRSESLRTRAEELLDAHRLEEAVEVLTALIAVVPDDHWGYRVRGVVRSELGDFAGAETDLDRSVQLAPEDAAGWARRAELRASGSDLASATVDAERALELDPASLVAWTARATIRRQQGDLAGAETDLTQALASEPDSAWLLTARAGVRDDAGDLHGALADVGRALDLDPSYAHGWALQAHVAGRAGENDLAVESASRAIALDPDSGWAYGNRGLARQELGDFGGAIADFDRVIELDPTDGWAWAARGRVRADGDDLEGALADLFRARELRPEDASTWTDWGRISVDLGDASGAIQAISRAIDLGGDNAYTYALRAKARWLAADFEHLMDRMSQDPPTLHHLLALAVGGAAVNQAMADLRRAFELDPEVAASVFGVGRGDDLRRLMDTIRLLAGQQPDDLEDVLTAVSRAMQSADATERLVELLTLESALEVRASTEVEGADVAHAATLELTLSAIDDVMRHGGADDVDIRDLRARTVSARARLPVNAPFKEEVDAMKARLTERPPAGPSTAPTIG
jgi:tetratricopeptide (TPR) repeat protein